MKDTKSFEDIANEIEEKTDYEQMKQYKQHKTNLYNHCHRVSRISYNLAIKLNWDYESVTRGALLHDYYLYDWEKEGRKNKKKVCKKEFCKKHGFTHPKIAYDKAKEKVELNEIEEDIILHHMFPLTITTPPKTKEGWLVNIVDTAVAIYEYMPFYKD